MNRQLLRVPVQMVFFFPFSRRQNESDSVTFEGTISEQEYAKVDPKRKTGMEGLKRMWQYDEVRGYSEEVQVSLQGGFYSGALGGLIMGAKNGRHAFGKWMRTNLGNKFVNERDAQKYLSDAVTLGVFKGFMKEGLKIGVFVASYLLTSNTVSVYRGKSDVLDFIIGGAFAGGAFRFWSGPKGFVLGIGLGSAVGLIGGGFYSLLLRCFGATHEEVKEYQMSRIISRQRAMDATKSQQDWDEPAQNAMLLQRKYVQEKDFFQSDPKP